MFSAEVGRVSGTRIFARVDAGWQHLAYETELSAADETAMVLPLPVAPGGGEDGLRFVSLEHYPSLFDDIDGAFPVEGGDLGRHLTLAAAAATLEVHGVGAFEASFVPTLGDFTRLDARFRMPPGVWDALPGYADFGFAVFKLKPGESRVHPMAFSFRTREPRSLFFPTVHVHARKVEPWAAFDHALYAQGRLAPNRDWASSTEPLGKRLRRDPAGVVLRRDFGYRRLLSGTYENRDVRVALA